MSNLLSLKSVTLLTAVSVCSITGYLLYLALRKPDDKDDDAALHLKRHTGKIISVEYTISNEFVPSLIGRNGRTIKDIEDRSTTRILFENKSTIKNGMRKYRIDGRRENCEAALKLIQQFVKNQPKPDNKIIEVEQSVVGRILGRCGEQVMELTRLSGAIIQVDRESKFDPMRKILVRGTQQQIEKAVELINEIVEKSSKTNGDIEYVLSKREPRKPKSVIRDIVNDTEVERLSPLIGGQSDCKFEVYVSGMIDPSCFWIQIVGPKAAQLDQLVEEMTEYYSDDINRNTHNLNEVCIGDLVAATFKVDNKWYRAEVIAIENSSNLKLFYLDYGDFDMVQSSEVYELRTDFLQLNFQAIECYLANIAPKDATWTVEAVDHFEIWTYMAQWKKLSARVLEYSNSERVSTKRSRSSIPGIALFDAEQGIDIADRLVSESFGVHLKGANAKSTKSGSSSLSNLSLNDVGENKC